ncbi:MAG: hypothetical protein GF341_12075 [candidate division Zixibacteria bacterium]|nr:hypothetical protein [candidate division Zixibacteria bacterium]
MTVSVKRRTAPIIVLVYLWTMIQSSTGLAQTVDCSFDEANPSIDNARTSFQIFDFQCAEAELQAVLQQESLSVEEKANAHMLLAAVYYEMFQDESERRAKILDQFKEAFTSYREWRGELDIQSPEFRELMEEARAAVEEERDESEPPVIAREPVASSDQSDGGSKKWLLIGLGAAVVVGGVALAAGGGGGDGNGGGGTTLPDFPNHPGDH